jgi:hypothetical protein
VEGRRPTNYELRLDRLQAEAEQADEREGILELFDRDALPEPVRDEDAPLERDTSK